MFVALIVQLKLISINLNYKSYKLINKTKNIFLINIYNLFLFF